MAAITMSTLTSILVDLGIEPAEIRGDAFLRRDIGLDSTEMVELTLEVRRRLGVGLKFEAGEDPTIDQVCSRIAPEPAATSVRGAG
jgi:acyl carrier protein